jgi:RimJ/RimL family protein N-acetyltransferase
MAGPWYPVGWPEREIGWAIWDDRLEGTGLAREAAEATRADAYGRLGWTSAISLIAPSNARSIALAERLGARPDGSYDHAEYGTLTIYRHSAPEAV